MKKKTRTETSVTEDETPEQPYRITWAVRTPLGRTAVSQMLQMAKSEARAVNQALAIIRHDYPQGVVIGCDLATRAPLMAPALKDWELDPTRGASGDSQD